MPDAPIFVGRQEELEALQRAVAEPEGKLILLVGEQGRGKSAILEELHRLFGQDEGRYSLLYRLNANDSSDLFLPRLMGDLLNIEDFTRRRLLWRAPGQAEKFRGLLKGVGAFPGLGASKSLGELLELLLPQDKRFARDRFLQFLGYASHLLKGHQRLVLMFDPEKYLDKSVEADWGSLARDLPDKVTILFAQRPDDVLAESQTLVVAPKVTRIPEGGVGSLSRSESDRLITRTWETREVWRALSEAPPEDLLTAFWQYKGWALPLTIALGQLPQAPAALDELLKAANSTPKEITGLLKLLYKAAVEDDGDALKMLRGLAILGCPTSCARLAALYPEANLDETDLLSLSLQADVAKCLRQEEGEQLDLFHATFGEFILAQLSGDTRRDLHRRAAALYQRDLDANKSDPEALDALPLHLYHFGDVEPFLNAVMQIGAEKYRLRLFRSYERDLRVSLDVVGQTAGPVHRHPGMRAKLLNNLGILLADLGQRPEARRRLEEALRIHRELARAEPEAYRPELAAALNNLGALLADLGGRAEARRCYKEALVIRRELAEADPGAYRPCVATTLCNLGNLLRASGDRPEARRCHEEALVIRRELAQTEPGAYRPYVATTLNNLANLLADLREWSETRRCYEEALGIWRELARAEPGAYRPDVAMTLNNLGLLLANLRESGEARRCLEEALKTYRESAQAEPGAYRPDLAMTLYNLGLVLADLGERAEARRCYKEALEIYRALAQGEPGAFSDRLATVVGNARQLVETTGEQPDDWPELMKGIETLRQLRPDLFESPREA